MDRWNTAGLGETRDTGLGRKSAKSRRVEGGVGGGKNSRRVVMPMKKRRYLYTYGLTNTKTFILWYRELSEELCNVYEYD